MLRDTLTVDKSNRLKLGGADCKELAQKFGTPLYCMDEAYIRFICRSYVSVLSDIYPDSLVCYASKAFCTKAIYAIVGSEGLGTDVVSEGELYTAASVGFDMSKVYFHGNNKTRAELVYALTLGVHAIVVDCESEVLFLKSICAELGVKARVLVRVNPGIEAHTHSFIQTSRVDSKFGVSVADGTAAELVRLIRSFQELDFLGIHAHIGSQIFELEPFRLAVEKLVAFIKALEGEGAVVKELNLGGGYGIHYTEDDKPLAPARYVETIARTLKEQVEDSGIHPPRLILEPGRSIVGEAGITLYSVGAVKVIKDIKKYVSVDGGMFDNPRFALYQAQYSVCAVENVNAAVTETVTVAGKCCESGDMIAVDVKLPPVKRGDVLAVFSTGAYNYSMSSNYNRNAVPPVVLVKDGQAEYIVAPQTSQDIAARDRVPEYLEFKNTKTK